MTPVIPQTTVVGQDHNNTDSSSFPPSPIGHAIPCDIHNFLFPPALNLGNSPHVPGSSPSHTSDTSSLRRPPSPTLSAHSSDSIRRATPTVLRDNISEEYDSLSSLGLHSRTLQGPRRKGNTGTVSSSTTDRNIDRSSSLRPSTVRSGHSDLPSTRPSATNTPVDARSDTRHPSPASFFKRTVQRVCHPYPPTGGGTGIDFDTTRSDSVWEGDHTDVKLKGAELARPAVLDLNQEADLNVEPFAFKPLQLAGLVDLKSLEKLENVGGEEGLLHGLGVNRLRGLSSKSTQPSQPVLPDPGSINLVNPFGVEMTPIMITPASMPEEPQCTVRENRGAGSGVGRPASLDYSAGAYEATIEDRQRIYGQNILPRRPSKSLFRLMWLALKDKVMVRPMMPQLSFC